MRIGQKKSRYQWHTYVKYALPNCKDALVPFLKERQTSEKYLGKRNQTWSKLSHSDLYESYATWMLNNPRSIQDFSLSESVKTMMGLMPRQGNHRLVFRLFSLMRGSPSRKLK